MNLFCKKSRKCEGGWLQLFWQVYLPTLWSSGLGLNFPKEIYFRKGTWAGKHCYIYHTNWFPWSLLLFISLWCFIRMDNIFSETHLYIFFFRSWYIFISGVDIFFYFRSWYISDFRSWYMFYFKSWYIFISGVSERLYCNLYLLLEIAKVNSDNKSIFRIKLENFV